MMNPRFEWSWRVARPTSLSAWVGTRTRRRWRIAFAGLALLSTASASEHIVVSANGTLTVKAAAVVLDEILRELTETVEFTLIGHPAMAQTRVTVDIDSLPWEEAFGRLLRGFSYSLEMDAVRNVPKRLIVLDRNAEYVNEDTGTADTAVSTTEVEDDDHSAAVEEDTEQRIREVADRLLAPPDRTALAVEIALAKQRDLEMAQLAALAAQADPAVAAEELPEALLEAREDYAEALRGLGDFDDPRVVDTLATALDSDDPETRVAALEAMRWVSYTSNNPVAIDKAYALAGSTSDPAIQRAALEVLVRYGDTYRVLPMVERLALSEGPNQDLAAREWLRIREEQRALAELRERADREGITLEELRQRQLEQLIGGGRN